MLATLVVKHVFTYFIKVLPVELAGIIILPFVLPFVSKNSEKLPRAFRWWDNHEIHLDEYNKFGNIDGLMGPWYHRLDRGITVGTGVDKEGVTHQVTSRNELYEKGLDIDSVQFVEVIGYGRRIWERYVWLAFRNPCYYYKWAVLGLQWTRSDWTLKKLKSNASQDELQRGLLYKLGDDTSYERFGYYYEILENTEGNKIFEVYLHVPYWPNAPIGARIRLGHKLKDVENLKENQYVQWEFSPNPFRKIDRP